MKLNTCLTCGRGIPINNKKCPHCGADAPIVVSRNKVKTFIVIFGMGIITWFLLHKLIQVSDYMLNPPIVEFDIMYDNSKFADVKAVNPQEFSENNWIYKFSGDSQKGVQGVAAQTLSTNITKLKNPYGSSKMELTLVKNGTDVEVLFQLIGGQLDCDIAKKDCFVTVRFDNSPAQKYQFRKAPNGRDDVFFIIDSEKFLAEIKNSTSTTVNVNIFNNGLARYFFNVKNLILDF